MFPDRWHPDTVEQLTHRMPYRHALPLLLGAQTGVFPEHPDGSKAAREFAPVLTMSCPLRRKLKFFYVDWSEEWVDEERLQLTTSAQGPPVQSNCLLLMRSYWLALLKKKINDHNQLQLSRLLKMLSISFPSPTCCFKALSPASRAAFFDSKISTDVS